MVFLFDCDNEVLLPATFDLAEEIERFYKKTNISELREAAADGESKNDKAMSNLKKILFRICKEYPKDAGAIFDKLWVLEPGEKAPNALYTFSKIVLRKDAIDFFTSLLSLVQ